jgi:hypothetical protein
LISGENVAENSSVVRCLGRYDRMRCRSGRKADVEHAVGLVEHHVLDLVEHRVLGFDVVEQAARRGHQHFDALLELQRLRLHVDAAEHHRAAQVGVLGVQLDLLGHLVGQLARGQQHQGAHRVPRGRGGLFSCLRSRCSRGSENAAVLPVPVWAAPITSLPVRTTGIACSWMGSSTRSPFRPRRAPAAQPARDWRRRLVIKPSIVALLQKTAVTAP